MVDKDLEKLAEKLADLPTYENKGTRKKIMIEFLEEWEKRITSNLEWELDKVYNYCKPLWNNEE